MLTAARRDVVGLLEPGFAERAGELGLADASLGYDAEPPSITVLEERLDRDIERGTTGAGPHLDEIAIRTGDRDLRTFGSQGEQRLAVLALLLAEAELIATRRRVPPLLLLDDALSELDASRRRILSERIGVVGQTIVTATGAGGPSARAGATARGHARQAWRRAERGAARRLPPRRLARRRRAGRRRARGRDPRAGRTSSATRLRAQPGRNGSRATARCSSRRARPRGPSSSACSARRSSGSSPPRSGAEPRRRSASARAPSPAPPAPASGAVSPVPPEIDDETRLLAEQLTAGMADEELRATIARAAAASLARAASSRGF